MTPTCTTTCHTNSEEASPVAVKPFSMFFSRSHEMQVKGACCVFPFFFDANGDGEVCVKLFPEEIGSLLQAEEHNTCIEVAEGGWCSTHVDQNQQFQEGRYGALWISLRAPVSISIYLECTLFFTLNSEKVGLLSTRGMRISYSS